MNSNLVIPTDNPFKFLAIFGLVLFLAGPFFVIASVNALNDTIFQAKESAYQAEAKNLPYKNQLILDLERKVEIAVSDHDFRIASSAVVSTTGIFMMLIGFFVWFCRIHPFEERLRKMQALKLKLETRYLRKNFSGPATSR